MSAATSMIPDSAPLIKTKGVPQTYKPVQLESHLFPTIVENIGTVLGIDVGYVPETIVASIFKPSAFPEDSGWGLAKLSVQLETRTYTAFLMTSLEAAFDWGACGLRRPQAGRQQPEIAPDGSITLTDELEQDFSAFYEVCNVVSCGVLARAWRSKLDRPVVILLDEVIPVSAMQFPAELNAKGLVAVQGTAGYSERKQPPAKDGTPVYEQYAPFVLIVPALLAVEVLWGSADGTERKKTEWLIKTGEWRWTAR
jgi:hypothetical protein